MTPERPHPFIRRPRLPEERYSALDRVWNLPPKRLTRALVRRCDTQINEALQNERLCVKLRDAAAKVAGQKSTEHAIEPLLAEWHGRDLLYGTVRRLAEMLREP